MSGIGVKMAHIHLSALFVLGFITLINGQCQVNFQNGTVSNNGSTCSPYSQTVFNSTLTCSAIQLSDLSQGNLNNLKAFTDAAFDLYKLLRSRLEAGQVVKYINQVRTTGPIVGSLHYADFARLWFQVKLNPHLSSLSRDTLSCLSRGNLSCQSFQELVAGLSLQIGPERRKMVYQNFVKPFLQRNTTDAGCVSSANNTGEWLKLNFQTFSASASLEDFYTLNPTFDGLLVLEQLSPEQKAQLVFQLEASSKLNLSAIAQIFQSFLQPVANVSLNTNVSDFLIALRPLGRFIKACVNISQNAVSNRNETIRLLVDWTISMANDSQISNNFSMSNFTDWLQYMAVPVMRKYLFNQTLPDTPTISNTLFASDPEIIEPVDNCKVTSSSCPTSQIEENLAKTVNCVAQTNLSLTEENLKLLITELTRSLQTLMNQSRLANNSSQSNLTALFVELPAESFTSGNLDDAEFMRFWFQIKMKPQLPQIPRDFLSCISTRTFSCQAYRALYGELNNNSGLMDSATQRFVLNDFIRPFLSRRQNTGIDCTSPFNNSADFVLQNFGSFSPLAQLQDFFSLSRNFSAVDAVSVLTMRQLDQLVFNPPAGSGDRGDILTKVFDFLLKDPNRDKLNNFLFSLQTEARKSNFSCDNYNVIFGRMDQKLSSVAPNQSEALLTIRDSVMMIPPDECISRSSLCTTPPVNEPVLCGNFSSPDVDQFLNGSAPNTTGVCNFTVLQFACQPTLSQLNSQQVADLLACKLSSNVTKEAWKLFFTKTSAILDDALLKFSNKTPSVSNVSLSDVLEVIEDIRISRLSPQRLKDPVFIRSLFQGLKPFLPSISQRLLSCFSTKSLTCDTYSIITSFFVYTPPQDICNPLQTSGTKTQSDLIYTEFIKAFLSRNDTNDPGCFNDTGSSMQWVNKTLGPFAQSAPLKDLMALNKNLRAVDILPLLGPNQLFNLSATPGELNNPQNVTNVMQFFKDCQLPAFFDFYSPLVEVINPTPDVKAALIKQIFERSSLSNLSITNQEVLVWMQRRINPLLANLSESIVSPLFTFLNTRDCNITQTAMGLLDAARPSFPTNTKNAVYNNILQSIKGPQPLLCYRNNSFIAYLNESLHGFGPLPNVDTFLSLIPPARKSELVNSIAPSELGSYLRQEKVVNNNSQICAIFSSFTKTPEFVEKEDVPDSVKSTILPCVWPLALASDNETEVDLWFNSRLKLYLKFLNKDLIGSKDTLSSSCQSYKKMVSVLGSNFTFSGSQITQQNVYETIKTYLKADTQAKCYNPSDAKLNSTAWFVNNIGAFITFLTLDDLYSFGPESAMKAFAVNPENIKLFNQPLLPKTVFSRYTELIFLQNPNFNLLELPSFLQCDAPASTFTTLNEAQTNTVLGNFKTSCSDVDPAISAALSRNIKTIDASAITNLGSQVVGLTTTQLSSATPSVLIGSLSTLGTTSGWSFGQAKAIIAVLLRGDYKINSADNLLNLGSLVGGIPSTLLTAIAPDQIVTTSQNAQFVKSIVAAPEIVQKTFVNQIIKVGTSTALLMKNIPSDLAVQIPRRFLEITTTTETTVLQEFNKKKWKPQQAVLFFDSVANVFEQPDDLSVEVLQGFTCSRVQTFTQTKIKGLIKACRRRQSREKVVLSETQLTCMYNLVRKESPFDFENYHPDMLLYFNYDTINKTLCKSYFTQVAAADLSIFSSTLSGRRDILLSNAMDCYGINRASIKKENLTALGNLVCAVSGDVIRNSDPEILNSLKNCKDLSDTQISAMQDLLMKGTSQYGQATSWNQKTLKDLETLPLYFSDSFWGKFTQSDLSKFLKTFLRGLREKNTPKVQMKRLFKAIFSATYKAKRAASCTNYITSVTISDEAFPFGYNAEQFSLCLTPTVVNDTLASLCQKIDDSSYQRIILDKLKEIQPNGLSEDQVQVLKSVSRVASVDEISKWSITKSDTLAALMNPNDGDWSSAQSEQILTRYLSANNTLSATDLNLVKGPNLCSLNASVLSTILPDSMRESDALDVSNCTSQKKKALFSVANKAFPLPAASSRSAIMSAFQLIETYLGGADLGYIRNLSSYNVSMSVSTFINLDADVISSLTISEVVGLLGSNLQDLKTFENQTVVRSWISQQLQSDLDKLNLGLTGGKATADTTTASPSTAGVTNATIAKPTSGAPGVGASGWTLSFSVLVLIFTILRVEII